jgi:threonine/homoserine/homoserine lactone efflux protein
MLLLSGVFMAMTFSVFIVYGALADSLRATVAASSRARQWAQGSFAIVFAALGIKLALTSR